MRSFLQLINWEFKLLQRNSIISISLIVTAIYGALLFFLRELPYLDEFTIAMVLNDPTVVGYFFIALGIFTEIKTGVLAALFVSPVKLHQYLWSKVIAISLLGTICALLLIISVKGMDFNWASYTIGSLLICLLSSLLGLITLTYTDDFLNFALLSVPVFLSFVVVPLLHFLGVIELGTFIYLFPIQAGLSLIEHAVLDHSFSLVYCLLASILSIGGLYYFTYRRFQNTIHLKF